MEETVEHRVDVVAAPYMMGTYILFIYSLKAVLAAAV